MDDQKVLADAEARRLPDGVIDSPELFLLAIKQGTGGHEFRDDALDYLERRMRADLAAVNADWVRSEQHYRMAYWTGAYLGLRIANRGYALRMQQLLQEAKEGKKPIVSA